MADIEVRPGQLVKLNQRLLVDRAHGGDAHDLETIDMMIEILRSARKTLINEDRTSKYDLDWSTFKLLVTEQDEEFFAGRQIEFRIHARGKQQ